MNLFTQDGKIIVRNGGVATEQECCCTVCAVNGNARGGPGVHVDEYEFPPTPHCLWFTYDAYFVPDQFTVEIEGIVVKDTGSISGSGSACIKKEAGDTNVKVTVRGPDGTRWEYAILCDSCPSDPACCTEPFFCNDGLTAISRCLPTPEQSGGVCDVFTCAPRPTCQITWRNPNGWAPYDCIDGGLFVGGAMVRVSNWSACIAAFPGCSPDDGRSTDPFTVWARSAAEWALNRSFWVPIPCLGAVNGATKDFNLGPRAPLPGDFIVSVSVNLCSQYARVSVRSEGNLDWEVTIDGDDLPVHQLECAGFNGCFCRPYSDWIKEAGEDEIPVINGRITVTFA